MGYEMILIDSNIWCYYFNESASEHKIVAEYLENILKKEKIVINTVIVMEVAHFLIKNLGSKAGSEKVDIFLKFPMNIVEFGYEEMKKSIKLLAKHSLSGIGGRDSTLLASMEKTRTKKIVTHDDSFKKIKGITVIDPVK